MTPEIPRLPMRRCAREQRANAVQAETLMCSALNLERPARPRLALLAGSAGQHRDRWSRKSSRRGRGATRRIEPDALSERFQECRRREKAARAMKELTLQV